jgi:hypothetical protein
MMALYIAHAVVYIMIAIMGFYIISIAVSGVGIRHQSEAHMFNGSILRTNYVIKTFNTCNVCKIQVLFIVATCFGTMLPSSGQCLYVMPTRSKKVELN